jgi:tetratricopeptide (TPR) repeat protein
VNGSESFGRLLEAGLWTVHLLRVATFVLVAAGCLLVGVRLVSSGRVADRAARSGTTVAVPPKSTLKAVVTLLGFLGAGYLAIVPDRMFLLLMADPAYMRGDCKTAAVYYEPLASWGTDEVKIYGNLGYCYVQLRRFREAIDTLHHVVELDPRHTVDAYEWCWYAHAALGETALAEAHLGEAAAKARSPENKARLEALLLELRGRSR